MGSTRVISNLGWYGHGNCGDEMFKQALTNIFPDYQLVFSSELKRDLPLINKSDFLLIGGGNIIDPKFLEGLASVNPPHSFIGVGITDPTNVGLLSQANQVFVRDQRSLQLLSGRKDSYLIPDLAFSLYPDRNKGKELLFSIPTINKQKPTIGVFLNDCLNTGFDSSILKFIELNKVTLELSRFLDSLGYNVLFIPMSFLPPDDRRISFQVLGNMKNAYKHHCIVNPLTPQECLDLTSALDFAITMRLHSAVFCTISGVPFIDITHHSKSKSYLETEGLSELSVDYYELSIRILQEKFNQINSAQLSWKEKLLSRAAKNNTQLQETLKNVRIP